MIAWNLCNEYATSPATIIKPIRKSEQMANINPLINNNFLFTSLGSKPLYLGSERCGLGKRTNAFSNDFAQLNMFCSCAHVCFLWKERALSCT